MPRHSDAFFWLASATFSGPFAVAACRNWHRIQFHGKSGATILAGALHSDLAVVRSDQRLRNRQAEAKTPETAGN